MTANQAKEILQREEERIDAVTTEVPALLVKSIIGVAIITGTAFSYSLLSEYIFLWIVCMLALIVWVFSSNIGCFLVERCYANSPYKVIKALEDESFLASFGPFLGERVNAIKDINLMVMVMKSHKKTITLPKDGPSYIWAIFELKRVISNETNAMIKKEFNDTFAPPIRP